MLLFRGTIRRKAMPNIYHANVGGSILWHRTFNPGSRNGAVRLYSVHSTVNHDDSFGFYDLILPPEPFIYGVNHIPVTSIPLHIPRPPYVGRIEGDPVSVEGPYIGDGRVELGEDEKKLRSAANLAKLVLFKTKDWVKPGITTAQIDENVSNLIVSYGAYPSPLGYCGFPKSCCTSVNNIIVHGIPDDRPLQNGDIVNVDITVFLDGFHGDTSQTFLVGRVDQLAVDLVAATNMALKIGIEACGPDRPFADIGRKIYEFARQAGFSVNDQLTGHGIGRIFHRPPWILHSKNDEPGRMLPGHVFTIEPALVQGDLARGWMFPDGWTVATESGARSAQAEHTVLITETGVDVLT